MRKMQRAETTSNNREPTEEWDLHKGRATSPPSTTQGATRRESSPPPPLGCPQGATWWAPTTSPRHSNSREPTEEGQGERPTFSPLDWLQGAIWYASTTFSRESKK